MALRGAESEGSAPAPEWLAAYLVVSALLGDPVEEALQRVDDASRVGADAIARGLRLSSRHARARAMALTLSEVVAALDAMRLA